MSPGVSEMIERFKQSGTSAALAVAAHIETIAPSNATNQAVHEECLALRDWAEMLASASLEEET